MYAYKHAAESSRDRKFTSPSDELRIAVTFKRRDGQDGPTKFAPPLSLASVAEFQPALMVMD